jgi:PAS domain S-box-containing protein
MRKKNYSIETKADVSIDLLCDSAVIADEKGRLLTANDAFEEVTGLDRKELIGKSFLELEFVPAESKKALLENLKKRMQGLPVQPYEVAFIDRNGKARYAEINARKINFAGQLADFVIFRDITERKKAEDAIRQSSLKINRIINTVNDGVYVLDRDWNFVYLNERMAKLVASEPSQMIGKNCWQLFPKWVGTICEKNLRDAMSKREFRSFEWIGLYSDDIWEINAFPSEEGIIVNAQCVTEQKKAEKALTMSEERYRKLFEASMDAIFVADAETGALVDCNHAALRMIDRKKGELIGKPQSILHPPSCLDGEFTGGFKLHLKNPSFVRETQVVTKNGEVKDVEIKASTFEVKGRKLIQGTFRDVTLQKLMEKEVKRALTEAEKSAREWQLTFDSASDIMALISPSFEILRINRVGCELVGKKQEELIGRKCYEVLHGLNAPITGCPCVKMLRTKKVGSQEITQSGRYYIASASPVMDENNELAAFVHSVKDITEIKKIEQKLTESEVKYRNIFNNAEAGMFRTRLDGSEILECNPKFLSILGRNRGEVVGKPSLIHWVNPLERKEMVRILQAKGHVDDFECRLLNKQGEVKTCLATFKLYPEQGMLEGSIIDITERKMGEETDRALSDLSNSLITRGSIEDMSAKVMEYAKKLTHSKYSAVCYIDEESGDLVFSAFTDVWGKRRVQGEKLMFKEVRGLWGWALKSINGVFTNNSARHPRSIGIPKGHAPIHNYLAVPAILNGTPVGIVVAANTPNGYTERDLVVVKKMATLYALAVQRHRTETQEVKYALQLENKVEERTKQLRETNERLVKSERLATIGELAGMVGHDLRNPLTGIKNAAYYLKIKQDSCLDDDKRKMFKVIDNAIAHADKIINDLLDYSREIRLELVNCSAQSILQEALSLVQVPDRVKIENHAHKELVIKADRTKMVRVFVNIVKNAIDAMPDGGTLRIKSSKRDASVEISFADTGVGMSKETLAKLFSPLVTTKAQGMGFGLAICKRVVEAHQGRITVQSVKGKGSTFTLTLPIEPKTKDEGEATWIDLPEPLLSTTKT